MVISPRVRQAKNDLIKGKINRKETVVIGPKTIDNRSRSIKFNENMFTKISKNKVLK